MKTTIRVKLLGSFAIVAALMAALGIVALDRLGDVESAARASGAEAAVHDAVASGRTWTFVLLALGLVVSVALAVVIGRSIAGSARELLAAARGIAEGDVRQRVELRSGDELGQTADAFREMIAYLDEMAAAARDIAAGELDVAVRPRSERDALGTAFAEMSAQLREALGDRSSLDALVQRMESMSGHCMLGLEAALQAARDGDLTQTVTPITVPVVAERGRELGRLGTIFNDMLARAQGSIEAYNAMRERIAAMLREISRETQAVSAASQQMASTAAESGRAVGEIANAVGEVAAGAERQVRTVEEARTLSEQVADATRSSRADAGETASAAEEARAVAADGAEAIARATEGMQALEEMAAGVTTAMRSLGTSPTASAGSSRRSPASPSRPTCSRSTPRSRRRGPATRAAASPSSPRRCASSQRSRRRPPRASPS